MVWTPWGPRLARELRPSLDDQERILAWAEVSHGPVTGAGTDPETRTGAPRAVVATNRGLWLPDAATRLGWHEIHKVTWSKPDFTLVPGLALAPAADAAGKSAPEPSGQASGYTVTVDAVPISLRLAQPGKLPEQVRLRVNRSIGYTEHFPFPGGGGATVVARRISGRDGLHWRVRYDLDTDLERPGIEAETGALIARARRHLGATFSFGLT